MPLAIRPAQARDHRALVEQFLALNRYEDAIAGNRRTDWRGAEESLAATMARLEETGGHALVAELDGQVVGHLCLVFKLDAAYVRPELRPDAYVSELFVRERARGQGVGSALMREAERLAAARGLTRITIGVLAGNEPTERLYRWLGYRPHAIEMEKAVSPDRGAGESGASGDAGPEPPREVV